MFNTHKNNIAQIKATIRAFGICIFHGDGNLYSDKKDSDFRQNFSNPKNENSQYRVEFHDEEDVPATVEELNKRLIESRSKEIVDSRTPASTSPIKTIKVDSSEAKTRSGNTQTDDEKLEDMIADEETSKRKLSKK